MVFKMWGVIENASVLKRRLSEGKQIKISNNQSGNLSISELKENTSVI